MRIIFFVFFLVTFTQVSAQNLKIKTDNFNKIVKQISDSLPNGWSAKTDVIYPEEIIIQSPVIDLVPDMTSNDPLNLNEKCEIYIMVVPRISPDSISIIRKKNKELQAKLPPQNSKDNLKNWYKQNEKTLKILDSEPTNYDDNYSYRIKCRRLPKNETDKKIYNRIMTYLNKLYKVYHD
jgi:hypothetical protein